MKVIKQLFFIFFILLLSCSIRNNSTNISELDNNILRERIINSEIPDSNWHGILFYEDNEIEQSGDFIINHKPSREFWSMNLTGPMGVSVFKVRNVMDSLLVTWKDEAEEWQYYRSWEDSIYEFAIPFGDFMFSMIVAKPIGEIVKIEDNKVYFSFKDFIYIVKYNQFYLPEFALLNYNEEEMLIFYEWDIRKILETTTIEIPRTNIEINFIEY